MSRLIGLTVGSLGDPPRNGLVPEVDMPTESNTGVYSNIARQNVSGNVTFSTANQVIQDKSFLGIVTRNANNIQFNNCSFQGGSSTPSTFGLVNCSSEFTPAVFTDCTFSPDIVDPDWNGITGINFTLIRCEILNCQDGTQIRKASNGFTGVTIQQTLIHKLARYTAAVNGVVHPTDTVTHNDCVQQFGGRGTILRGNFINASHARQIGHWVCVGDPAVEPYVPIALNSLPDGGPYRNLPDRGNGNEASGRYNGGDHADLSCIMINDSAGASYDWQVLGNWFAGGDFTINGGGNQPPAGGGVSLGQFYRNRFYRDQGNQGTGGNGTQTINLQGGTWTSTTADIPTTGVNANKYIDGAAITVRY